MMIVNKSSRPHMFPLFGKIKTTPNSGPLLCLRARARICGSSSSSCSFNRQSLYTVQRERESHEEEVSKKYERKKRASLCLVRQSYLEQMKRNAYSVGEGSIEKERKLFRWGGLKIRGGKSRLVSLSSPTPRRISFWLVSLFSSLFLSFSFSFSMLFCPVAFFFHLVLDIFSRVYRTNPPEIQKALSLLFLYFSPFYFCFLRPPPPSKKRREKNSSARLRFSMQKNQCHQKTTRLKSICFSIVRW